MRPVFVRSGYPEVSYPFFSFQYITSSMQTILVSCTHPATFFIYKVIIPHDGCSFSRTDYQTLVAVVAEVKEVHITTAWGHILMNLKKNAKIFVICKGLLLWGDIYPWNMYYRETKMIFFSLRHSMVSCNVSLRWFSPRWFLNVTRSNWTSPLWKSKIIHTTEKNVE